MVRLRILAFLGLAGLVIGSPTCFLSPLYPHGNINENVRDTVEVGDDDSFVVNLDEPIPFYGNLHSSLHISTNGVLGFGTDVWEPEPPIAAGGIAYIASFWNDHDMFTFGTLLYRQVDLSEEPGILCLLRQDAAAAKIVKFTPTMVFIVTWKHAAPFDGEPDGSITATHQIVLATNGTLTQVVINYGAVEWDYVNTEFAMGHSAVQFDRGNNQDWASFPISRTSNMRNIGDYSNMGHAGRFVLMVDSDIQLPALKRLVCRSCAADKPSGDLTTFDGSEDLAMTNSSLKYIFSKNRLSSPTRRANKCKFMVRVVTDAGGLFSWFSLSAGVHPNTKKFKMNIMVDKNGPFSVDVRGHNYAAASNVTTFPFYVTIQDALQCLMLVVDVTPFGVLEVTSPMCQYRLTYDLTTLRLFLGSKYNGKTIGMCQNNNGNAGDDDKMCKPNSPAPNLKKIGKNCSCPTANNTVCVDQQKW